MKNIIKKLKKMKKKNLKKHRMNIFKKIQKFEKPLNKKNLQVQVKLQFFSPFSSKVNEPQIPIKNENVIILLLFV